MSEQVLRQMTRGHDWIIGALVVTWLFVMITLVIIHDQIDSRFDALCEAVNCTQENESE